jgi:hypothetical protein
VGAFDPLIPKPDRSHDGSKKPAEPVAPPRDWPIPIGPTDI